MQILNLIAVQKSDIKYTVSRFPDGEVQLVLDSFSRKDAVQIKCRITNAEELFLVKQAMDILDRHEVVYDVFISYLMGMRMDRVMDFNRPFTLKIVTDILKNSKARSFEILGPHSGRTLQLLDIKCEPMIPEHIQRLIADSGYALVLPDAGAKERYESVMYLGFPSDTIFCSKVRDVKTGKILRIQVDNPAQVPDGSMLIVDDLCDGGGTFAGVAAAIREINPDAQIDIAVTHMVNPKGIETLSKNFRHVWFTNSYKDWENLPENVTMVDIFSEKVDKL